MANYKQKRNTVLFGCSNGKQLTRYAGAVLTTVYNNRARSELIFGQGAELGIPLCLGCNMAAFSLVVITV